LMLNCIIYRSIYLFLFCQYPQCLQMSTDKEKQESDVSCIMYIFFHNFHFRSPANAGPASVRSRHPTTLPTLASSSKQFKELSKHIELIPALQQESKSSQKLLSSSCIFPYIVLCPSGFLFFLFPEWDRFTVICVTP
jgi:hypothetical protein